MTVNKDPFIRTRNKDGLPSTFRGLVQAGATDSIHRGALCVYNKTAGYWVEQSAVNDFIYALAIAKEEQKAGDSARYIEFYSLHPDDEFEFAINAARSLALGDRFILTVSNAQLLTYSAVATPVARCVDYGHYPHEEDTTIRSRSYAVVSFMPNVSAWGLLINGCGLGQPKYISVAAALTLYPEMSGLVMFNTATATHVLPTAGTAPAGCHFTACVGHASAHGFEVGTGSAMYIEGAKQTDDKNVTMNAIGDTLKVVADPNHDWVGIGSVTSAADATGCIDVE